MAKKKDAAERAEEAVLEGGSRVYELGFHLDPELPAEEVKKAYQDLRAAVERAGPVVAEGEPVMTQLAYTVSRQDASGGARRDFNSAQFAWIAYETSAENHAQVVAAAQGDPRVIRFIDLVTDKEAARHAAELRELAVKAPAPAAEAEPAAADAELDAAIEHAAA